MFCPALKSRAAATNRSVLAVVCRVAGHQWTPRRLAPAGRGKLVCGNPQTTTTVGVIIGVGVSVGATVGVAGPVGVGSKATGSRGPRTGRASMRIITRMRISNNPTSSQRTGSTISSSGGIRFLLQN